jgi:hypothetical protein
MAIMVDGVGHARDGIATLDTNRAKSRFGVAYVRAVCSQAGVGFQETSPDEDVLAVDGNVEFEIAPAGTGEMHRAVPAQESFDGHLAD